MHARLNLPAAIGSRRTVHTAPPIIVRTTELKIVRNLSVFHRDLIGAASHALAANLAAVARDEPEHFIVALAAERAVTIAHDASSDD